MVVLALLLQLAAAPPVPLPPAENLAAAVSLWVEHPPSPQEKQWAIDFAVATAATEALARVGVQPSVNLAVTERYLGTYDRLRPLIAQRLPKDFERIDRAVAECAMEQIARTLSVSDIAELRRFMSSPTGSRYWDVAGPPRWVLKGCYRHVLDLRVTDDDYRAIGLKPPKPPKHYPPGSVVYR